MARRLFLSLAAGAAALVALPVEAAPVSIQLAAEKPAVTTADDVYVRFTVRNATRRDLSVLRWNLPFGEIDSDLFLVTRDGMPVSYLGALAKRGQPSPDDFLTVPSRRALAARVELTSLYDMSKPGRYEISYRAGARDVVTSVSGPEMLVSNAVQVDVTGEPRESWTDFAESLAAGGEAALSYTKCTASQQSTVATAVTNAASYSENSKQALANSQTGNRFLTWFKSTSNKTTAYNHFVSIDNAFDTKPVVVDCGCKKQYYAYVYPTQPYKIYVCKAFWTAPMTGQDSKAGTLVHEMSHFNVVAGTDDHAYGHTACKALSASLAIDNADTHEYYAENTPNLGPY